MRARQVEALRASLLLLWGAVVFVLLIACVNVANLMLARSAQREHELAIRVAVGGGPGRLLRQLLTESLVIASLGGIGGLVLAVGAIEVVPAFMPNDVPRLQQIAVNGRLLGLSVALVVMTALLFGFAPARQVVRQHVGRFIGLQVFLDERVDAGARVRFIRETLDRIRALAGVDAAGAVSSFPLGRADLTIVEPLTLHDRPPPPPGEELSAAVSLATPSYIDALQIPLRHGRWFEERDDVAGPQVVVVNETLARRHWQETDALARRLTVEVSGRAFEAEIVGVVGAVRPRGFDSLPRPDVFVPHAQGAAGGATYDGGLGLAALALAGVGIYGVIAVATGQRTREMGLRLAMGAQPRDVVRMVVGGAVGLASAGVAAGLLATLVASRALVPLLFEVSPTDPATLAGVSVLLLSVAATAACVPARRAARLDPLAALRTE